jgi:transcriptional regulator with XRE-family HTH domain
MIKNKNHKKTIGQIIKGIRKSRGISQMELAEMINVSYQQIQKYEKGISNISVERLKQIAKALNVPASSFFSAEREAVSEHPGSCGKMTDEEQLVVRLFREIKNKQLRRTITDILRVLAEYQV